MQSSLYAFYRPSRRIALGAVRTFFAVVSLIGLSASYLAAQPALPNAHLFSVFPAGGKQGTTFEINVAGDNLENATKLLFSDPGITAAPITRGPELGETGPQPLPGRFTLTIKPEVKPGFYEARAIGKYGISNPRAFVVGTHNEVLEKEPNNSPAEAMPVELGTVVNGHSDGTADQDFYKFKATKGQRIVIDCWAYRIDSRMDPSLVIYDSSGRELDRNRDTNRRDPLVDFTAPADGEYIVKVHDFLFRGNSEYFYRLLIGAQPYIDFVFPPSGLPGSHGQYLVYGRHLPGSQPAKNMVLDGKTLEVLPVEIALPGAEGAEKLDWGSEVEPSESGLDAVEYRLQTPQGLSNPTLVGFAAAPVILEQEPNNDPAKAQMLTVPCEFVGQFYPAGDQDWVSFQAKAGDVYWIEVFSQRLGHSTDPSMLVQQVTKNDKGEIQVKELQSVDDVGGNIGGTNFDTTTDDPSFRFVAPADGLYRILLRDLNGSSHADPRSVYRLSIRPPKPDFRLVAVPRFSPAGPDGNAAQTSVWSPLLRKGGSDVIDVLVFRREGFDAEIQLTVEGLPPGVTCSPIRIPNGQNATIVLTAADNAAESANLINIVGTAKVGETQLTHSARTASMIWQGVPNQVAPRWRVTRNLGVAVSGESIPFTIAVDAPAANALEMCRTGVLKVPVKVVRRGDFKGVIALKPENLPPGVTGKPANIEAAATSGTLELTITNGAPLNSFSTFYVQGTSGISYARNPEAAQAAAARKATLDKLVADRQAAAKAATEARAAADKAVTESAAAAAQATQAQGAAAKAAADLQAALGTAVAQAKTAAEAAGKESNNSDLASAKEAADKAAADLTAKSKEADGAKAAADKTAAETAAKAKAAADAKPAADKALAAAEAAVKEATAVQQSVAAIVTDLTNKAKPQNIQINAPSANATITITATPITLSVNAPTVALKQGEKIEIPVTISRLYGFAGPVPLKVTPPADAGGLKIKAAPIAEKQNEAILEIEATKAAAVAVHKLTIQALPKFTNQDLPVATEITLTVVKAEPAAK